MAEASLQLLNKSLVEFGVMVTLALVMVAVVSGAFVYMLIKINPTQQQLVKQQAEISDAQKQISATLNAVSANLTAQSGLIGIHDQRALDMHMTCKQHGDQIKDLYDKGNETVKSLAILAEKMADLAKELYALKTVVQIKE